MSSFSFPLLCVVVMRVMVAFFDSMQDILGWGENDRGVSYTFGRDVVQDFLKKHNLSLICRAHQVRMYLTVIHFKLLSIATYLRIFFQYLPPCTCI